MTIFSLDSIFTPIRTVAQNTAMQAAASMVPNLDIPNLSIPGIRDSATRALAGSTENALGQAAAQNDATPVESTDARVRLKALNPAEVYGPNQPSNLLSILYETGGMLFPYTPSINFSQTVNYQSVDLVHTNGSVAAYQRTPNVELTVSGKFTVQNRREGVYALAAIHFLRTASKMYFGEQDGPKAGLPPPILLFSGYGTYMFNDLKVILKSHSFPYDENVDTVNVQVPGGFARLPVMFTIQLNLEVQNAPKAMRKEFSLDKFRTGELMTKGGWI
jgi:hypothetical protein